MLILDDILLSPMNGVLWIFNEISNAVEQELRNESESITLQLQELYGMLESGKVSEEDFDRLESALLDRLEAFEERQY